MLTLDVFLKESETKIHTPIKANHSSLQHIGLQRKFGGQFLIPGLMKLFDIIYSHKNNLLVEHCHW